MIRPHSFLPFLLFPHLHPERERERAVSLSLVVPGFWFRHGLCGAFVGFEPYVWDGYSNAMTGQDGRSCATEKKKKKKKKKKNSWLV